MEKLLPPIEPGQETFTRVITGQLPRQNDAYLAGRLSLHDFGGWAQTALDTAPEVDGLSERAAQQLTVTLGILGDSVASHRQTHSLKHGDGHLVKTPERSFEGLEVGPDRLPFLAAYTRIAAQTGEGDPERSCLASLVDRNLPAVHVTYQDGDDTFEHTMDSAFADGKMRTYTTNPGERNFFALIKKCAALEQAANLAICNVVSTIDQPDANPAYLDSHKALSELRKATSCLDMTSQLMRDFGRLPEEERLKVRQFLDVFRQFAAHWRPGDVPQSGAQDVDYLFRDFLLGIKFEDYYSAVQNMFPALLQKDKDKLTQANKMKPLYSRALELLNIDTTDLRRMDEAKRERVLTEHPSVAMLYKLYEANYTLAAVHYKLVNQYLVRPHQQRLEEHTHAGLPDEKTLVPNDRGTTGMTGDMLRMLMEARRSPLPEILGGTIGKKELAKHQPELHFPPDVRTLPLDKMVRFVVPRAGVLTAV